MDTLRDYCPPEHLAAFDAQLEQIAKRDQPTRLHIVTAGPSADPCTGTMTCGCQRCVKDRVTRAPRGGGHQPWMPRPARLRNAA